MSKQIKTLSAITDAFESLLVGIAEGKAILEKATIDEGGFRTVFRLSTLKDSAVKQDAPIRRPIIAGTDRG